MELEFESMVGASVDRRGITADMKPMFVNDVHSKLQATQVSRIVRPGNVAELQETIRLARATGSAVSVMGGRHAMGAQQFGTGNLQIDMTGLDQIVSFDLDKGLIEVQAGAYWPHFTADYLRRQEEAQTRWGFAQKQSGADNISIGGTIAANAHGRGLTLEPFNSSVEEFMLVDAEGNLLQCSRESNADLFRLVIGGYGLFGIVASVKLRLVPRQKMRRVVEIREAAGLMDAFEERIDEGFLYGDFQFAIDSACDDFLNKGVFSCYEPVDPDTPMPLDEKVLSDESWRGLLHLAHGDKEQAFRQYAGYYLSTQGQLYWSDTHQMSIYPENYHDAIDLAGGLGHRATEIITEIDVPRSELASFLAEAREDFRTHKVDLIYGTVRLIEKETDSFLPWARQAYACTIFNLHTEHTPEGIERSAEAFRRLIDMAIRRNGTYYLTYHRYAQRDQVLACYPEFVDFLKLKKRYDPEERFQSDWYRHYKAMFQDLL